MFLWTSLRTNVPLRTGLLASLLTVVLVTLVEASCPSLSHSVTWCRLGSSYHTTSSQSLVSEAARTSEHPPRREEDNHRHAGTSKDSTHSWRLRRTQSLTVYGKQPRKLRTRYPYTHGPLS